MRQSERDEVACCKETASKSIEKRDRCSAAKKSRDLARSTAIELSLFRARGERLASAFTGKNGLEAWDSG